MKVEITITIILVKVSLIGLIALIKVYHHSGKLWQTKNISSLKQG